jgi:hypothetical protein
MTNWLRYSPALHTPSGASRRVLEKSGFALERTAIYHGEEVIVYRSPVEARVR